MKNLLFIPLVMFMTFLSYQQGFGQNNADIKTHFGDNFIENTKKVRDEVKNGQWFIESKQAEVDNGKDMNHIELFSFHETFNLSNWITSGTELGVTFKPIQVSPEAKYGLDLSLEKISLYFYVNSKNEYDIVKYERLKPLHFIKKSEKSDLINPGGENALRIRKKGYEFEFYINDKVVYSFSNETNEKITYVGIFIINKGSFEITSRYLNNNPPAITSTANYKYTPQEIILEESDFEKTKPSFWSNTNDKGYMINKVSKGQWFIENQHLSVPQETNMDWLTSFNFPESIVLENKKNIEIGVTIKPLKISDGVKYGMSIFSKTAEGYSEMFFLISDKQKFDVIIDDRKSVLYLLKEENCAVIKPGDINTVKIRKVGSKWDFFINNKIVYTYFEEIKTDIVAEHVEIQGLASLQIISRYLNKDPDGSGKILKKMPKTTCREKDKRYVNQEYGYTLCLENKEIPKELSFAKYHYWYLQDFITVSGYSKLPFYVCTINFKGEKDSLAVFKKFEEEFFNRLGEETFVKKEIFRDVYTPLSSTRTRADHFRGYSAQMKSGGSTNIGFQYLLDGNGAFDAICFVYMAPEGLEGMVYSLHNEVLLLECVVLDYK